MASEHLRCPVCFGPDVISLRDILWSMNVDYFRCSDCRSIWTISTLPDATVILISQMRERIPDSEQSP
jgi:hypothetical protein